MLPQRQTHTLPHTRRPSNALHGACQCASAARCRHPSPPQVVPEPSFKGDEGLHREPTAVFKSPDASTHKVGWRSRGPAMPARLWLCLGDCPQRGRARAKHGSPPPAPLGAGLQRQRHRPRWRNCGVARLCALTQWGCLPEQPSHTGTPAQPAECKPNRGPGCTHSSFPLKFFLLPPRRQRSAL